MKSSFPYLVDMKITNACPFGCEFCYTSSVKEAKEADSYFTYSTLKKVLFEANVFEVVFGGGEPTLVGKKDQGYYNIKYLVESYRSSNFKVGLTTKNYAFYKDKLFADTVKALNTIAISANTLEELEKAFKLRDEIQTVSYDCQVYIQNILELHPYEYLQEFLRRCKEKYVNTTLLGYKNFGFGENVAPNIIPDDWIKFVKELGINVGVDSILANKYREKLIDGGVKDYYLVGGEGESSCYVDAVEGKIAASSFTKESVPIPTRKQFNGVTAFDSNKFTSAWFLEEFSKL